MSLYLGNTKITPIETVEKNTIVKEKDVNFYDYDGTLLYSYSTSDFLGLSEMPENPSHQGLVAQGWNWTLADAKTYVQEYGVLDVGQIYTTESGLSEFDIELTEANGLSVTLNMSGNKDWGDGTTDQNTTHTYSQIGKYTIKCDGTMRYNTVLFEQTNSNPNFYCVFVRLGNLNTIYLGALRYCYNLRNITISNSVTRIEGRTFEECRSLKNIIFPKNLNFFEGRTNEQNYTLENVIFSSNVQNFSVFRNGFSYCYSLEKMVLPRNLTEIGDNFFGSCYSIKNLIIPKTVARIGSTVFSNCYRMEYYDFSYHTSIPTLSNSDAFNGINKLTKIIVPDDLYEDWIAATNWSTYASYIIKKSDWDAL